MGILYFYIDIIAKNEGMDMERFTSLKRGALEILPVKPKPWRERNENTGILIRKLRPYRRDADGLRLHQPEQRYDHAHNHAPHNGDDHRAYHGSYPAVH